MKSQMKNKMEHEMETGVCVGFITYLWLARNVGWDPGRSRDEIHNDVCTCHVLFCSATPFSNKKQQFWAEARHV